MSYHRGVARDTYGNSIGGATVTVYEHGTTTQATIYEDALLATTLSNPFTSEDDGSYEFYSDPAFFDIQIAKAGFNTVTFTDILVGTQFLFAQGSSAAPYALPTATAEELDLGGGFAVTWSLTAGSEFWEVDGTSGHLTYTGPYASYFKVKVKAKVTNATGATDTTNISMTGTSNGVGAWSTFASVGEETIAAGDTQWLEDEFIVKLETNGTMIPLLQHTEGVNQTITIASLQVYIQGID